jgi:hypothetical protein
MRQTHLAGDKLFVDWASDRVSIIDPATPTGASPFSSSSFSPAFTNHMKPEFHSSPEKTV